MFNCLSHNVLFSENLQIAAKVVLDESVKCVEQELASLDLAGVDLAIVDLARFDDEA